MFSNQLAKKWPYKWFDFRGDEEKYVGRFFSLDDYVDTTCPLDIRAKIVSYLSSSPIALVGQVDKRRCGLCEELVHPASYRSDGIWLWPDHLSHDVEKHNFCVPNAMVEDILKRDGIPPETAGVPWQELPWP
jgi:hypothetical protein